MTCELVGLVTAVVGLLVAVAGLAVSLVSMAIAAAQLALEWLQYRSDRQMRARPRGKVRERTDLDDGQVPSRQ